MKTKRRIAHPFPYQGSKRRLAPFLLEFVPHDVKRFVEPFVGSGAMTIAVANAGYSSSFWLNDINGPLITLWHEIVESSDELCDEYRKLWESQIGRDREFYNEVRDRFNKTKQPADFLYLLARCVKAAIRYNSKGEFNNSPDKRRLGMRPETMELNIKAVATMLQHRCQITCGSYIDVLKQCNVDDVIYMDPPYQGVCETHNHRYLAGVEFDQFVDALEDLVSREVPFIVSYDGRTGKKLHGQPLPKKLKLIHHEVFAGRSTQATLLGRSESTYESVYVSQILEDRVNSQNANRNKSDQLKLFQE